MTPTVIYLTILLCATKGLKIIGDDDEISLEISVDRQQNRSDESTTSSPQDEDDSTETVHETRDCPESRYRPLDGSCNNLERPDWGSANTPYVRLARPNYADGISEIAKSVTGAPLPNARELSTKLFLNKRVLDPVWNLNSAQWGQILAHDMSKTAGVSQTRGGSDMYKYCSDAAQNDNNICTSISVSINDPTYTADRPLIHFIRSQKTIDVGYTAPNGPAATLTTVTGFMDLSLVYGNSDTEVANLRTGHRGTMSTLTREGQQWPPQSPNASEVCKQSPDKPCYLGGDTRINQNIHLTLLQVILLREHNRLAEEFANMNPHWNDEKVFQEARRLLIAVYQHINYYEYLPILLGSEHMYNNKLIYRNYRGYINDYDPSVNPSIIDEYATASYRHFHNLIRGYLQLLSENRRQVGIARLSDWYNTPVLLETDDGFNKLTRGLTAQKMSLSDTYWTAELTEYLFRGNKTYGDDLRAIDIERGRDHGLASYVSTRAACNLSVPKTFQDMREYISNKDVAKLKRLYASPKDVDLVVGGSLEINVRGSMVGPTFLCILIKQFYNTRVGDRYFYENGADSNIAFTLGQLKTIRKDTSMARLLCDNAVGVDQMQPKAFELITKQNGIVPCGELASIDLTQWRDNKTS